MVSPLPIHRRASPIPTIDVIRTPSALRQQLGRGPERSPNPIFENAACDVTGAAATGGDPLYRRAAMDGPWVPTQFDDLRFQQFRQRMDYEPGWHVVVGCACNASPSIGGLLDGDDDFPPSARPPQLKPYAHVKATITSSPLDLPQRAQQLRDMLTKMGWRWVERGIDTTVHTLLGVPLPGSHAVDVLLLKLPEGTPFTAQDAQNALEAGIKAMNVDYSALAAWAGEVKSEVIQPTLDNIPTPWDPWGWWKRMSPLGKAGVIVVGLGLGAVVAKPYVAIAAKAAGL